MVEFDSVNPYQSLEFFTGNSPEELVKMLKSIGTPIKIVAIVPFGNRHVAYVTGDVRKDEVVRRRPPKITHIK